MSKNNAYLNLQSEYEAEEKDGIIKEYSPIIKNIAQRMASRFAPYVTIDDMISVGVIGLIDAISKFDKNKGVKFRTYAEYRIRGSMLDELRGVDWVPRSTRDKIKEMETVVVRLEQKYSCVPSEEEIAREMNISLDELHEILFKSTKCSLLSLNEIEEYNSSSDKKFFPKANADKEDDVVSRINLEWLKSILASSIQNLTEKEKLVISLYYYDEITMKEIGEILGLTESRVSQIHSKALFILQTKIRKKMKT
ncbi:MAG: FliA/WhiG family RNA polymerase sigma factor [Candidatus Schekmanbacteria bacterium]|nr:FliA/WhiG family RNA polymerase sigma factor [Candidatus Schekmanbacteria bacterium]